MQAESSNPREVSTAFDLTASDATEFLDKIECGDTLSSNVLSHSITQQNSPYEQLSRERHEFRLVRVIGQDAHGLVRCHIAPFTLDDAPAYDALSYRWGKPDMDCKIELNGILLPVRKNLLRFLIKTRHHIKSSYMWIDAICINQLDLQERTHQVAMMSEIYTTANGVLLWLGPSYGNSDLAMKTLASDPQHWSAQRKGLAWRRCEGAAIRRLCERTYWTRLWMVQELVLARRVVILCGGKRAPLRNLEAFLRESVGLAVSSHPEHNTEHVSTMHSPAKEMLQQTSQDFRDRTLVEQILAFGHLECSDLRDKVFALLSIAKKDLYHPRADYAIGISALLNRVLELDLCLRPPGTFNDVKFRATQLAKAVGFPVERIFVLEEPRNNAIFSDADMKRTPLMHMSTGISLWWCVFYDHKSVIKLWPKEPELDLLRRELIKAASLGHEAACRVILMSGAVHVNWHDGYLCTPLMHAVQHEHKAACLFLLNEGMADVNCQDRAGATALYRAVDSNLGEMVVILLTSNQMFVELNGVHRNNPLERAYGRGYKNITRMLLARPECRGSASDLEYLEKLLGIAAEVGHAGTVESLLQVVETVPDENKITRLYHLTLNVAAKHGRPKLVELLLKRQGQQWSHKTINNMIIRAARAGHTAVLRLLLDLVGTIPKPTYSSAMTAVAWSGNDDPEIITLLRQHRRKDETDRLSALQRLFPTRRRKEQ